MNETNKATPSKRRGQRTKPDEQVRDSYAERYAAGKALRTACPRKAHAHWKASSNRPDAVNLILQAENGRLQDLLPLRHGRMARSPFTFYRGAALTMATDLATTPSSGIRLQCCGDAHLCNFGGFATPERKVVFSINDLDETLPTPWEWDLKRLSASFVIASRDNGLTDATAKDVALACVRTYRESMAAFSRVRTLDLWYRMLEADELVAGIQDRTLRQRALQRLRKEQAKSIADDVFPKLVEHKGEVPAIKDQLPTVFHAEGHPPGEIQKALALVMARYTDTLPASTQSLFNRYQLRDAAIKVVGIGSVGTACWVLLFTAGDGDPLFLQAKEARASVLEPFAGKSVFSNHGQRVVNGYRMMQSASDMFLGWTEGLRHRHYYIRQLRDIKISIRVETFGATEMTLYAGWCGKALALAHARSGHAALLSGYMGKSDTLDQAIAAFSMAYADQNEKDHSALALAIRSGKVQATAEPWAGHAGTGAQKLSRSVNWAERGPPGA